MAMTTNDDRSDDVTPEMQEAMETYGISRFPIYHYRLGPYRYSNLRDAVAQAKRDLAEN